MPIPKDYLAAVLYETLGESNIALDSSPTFYENMNLIYDWLVQVLARNNEDRLRERAQYLFRNRRRAFTHTVFVDTYDIHSLSIDIQRVFRGSSPFRGSSLVSPTVEGVYIRYALAVLYKQNWFSRKQKAEMPVTYAELRKFGINLNLLQVYHVEFEHFSEFLYPIINNWLVRPFNRRLYSLIVNETNKCALEQTVHHYSSNAVFMSFRELARRIYIEIGSDVYFNYLVSDYRRTRETPIPTYSTTKDMVLHALTYILAIRFVHEYVVVTRKPAGVTSLDRASALC